MIIYSNPGLHWFSLTFFSVIGPENSHHPLNKSDAKLKINCDLEIRVSPHFNQFTFFHFEFLLANDNESLCSDWSPGSFWFWFFDTPLETASAYLFEHRS